MRITLREPKIDLAGVILHNSFARFDALMATFSEERAKSRRFCHRASGFIDPKLMWYERTL